MKSFFKMLFASVIGVIVGFLIISVIGFVIFAGMVASMGSSTTFNLQKNTVLKVNLNEKTSIAEQNNSNPFDAIFNRNGESYGLNDILSAIKKAKDNDNIKGIFLNAGLSSAGFTTMEPIRNALLDFKKSGKFVIAYGENFSQPTYYVSSAADTIFMNPSGILDFRGLATSLQFNKGAFEKWGIGMQVYKVGTYKSAVEPYILNKMSDANREQVTSFLNDIWGTVLKNVSESRKVSVEQLNQYADELLTLTDPKKAVDYKLIDGLKYADEVDSYLKSRLNLKEDDKINFAGVKNMLSVAESAKKIIKDKIAVLYAEGEIISDAAISGFLPGNYITAKEYVKELNKLKDDKNVKAVVFRVNSPGGSAYESEQIWHAVKELKAVKPVVVSMGTYAASGGYYISCAANKIVAEPTTLTGSIGIFGLIPNGAELAKKMGVTFDGVSTNKFSDFGGGFLSIPYLSIGLSLPARALTDAEGAKVQAYIERGYDLFTTHCAEGRGKTQAAIDSIGQGRVWTGNQALKLGLVDELGGIDAAIKDAAELAKVDNYSINEYPAKKDFFMDLLNSSTESAGERIMMEIVGKDVYQQKQMLKAWQNYDIRQAIMPEFINQ